MGPKTGQAGPKLHNTDKKADALQGNTRSAPLYAVDPTLALTFSVAALEGSFTRAAALLGVNPSTISRRLDGLETSLGVRLFERDTRHLSLSSAGQVYFDYVQQAFSALQAGRYAMESHRVEVSGRLRVTCGPMLGRLLMVKAVQDFMALHSKVSITLVLDAKAGATGQQLDGFDVAVSLGMPDDNRAVVSKLADISYGYVASPAFLARHGHIENAAQLAQLPLAGLGSSSVLHDYGVVSTAFNELASAGLKFSTNDEDALQQALLGGQFVGRLMLWPCLDALSEGRLAMVLPELNETHALYTVAPARKEKSLKAQLFIDFLKTRLTEQIRLAQAQLAGLGAQKPATDDLTPEV